MLIVALLRLSGHRGCRRSLTLRDITDLPLDLKGGLCVLPSGGGG